MHVLNSICALFITICVYQLWYTFNHPVLWFDTGTTTVNHSTIDYDNDEGSDQYNYTIDVTKYGVIGDGINDDTNSMRYIFNEILPNIRNQNKTFFTHKIKIVIVIIPQYSIVLCGPLMIQSINNLILQIDGRIQALDINNHNGLPLKMWPIIEPIPSYGNSRDTNGMYYQYQPFLYMKNVSNIRITGNGMIDGYGQPWWDKILSFHAKNKSIIPPYLVAGRPNLIQIMNSSYIEIDHITIQDSPFWTLHPILSSYIHIHHITINASLYAPNVDGIDPDSCQHVLIEYVHIACGDDHIAIKAGVCGTSSPNKCTDTIWSSGIYQTNNITVRHSTFGRGMGIAIGSEMSGGIQNVHVYNNTIGLCNTGSMDPDHGCGWGPALHIKTTIARGGYIRNVSFHNNTVWNTSMFILLEIGYQTNHNELPPVDYQVTKVHDISFVSNQALGSAMSATFYCSIYDLCHNITLLDNSISIPEGYQYNPWNCHFVAPDYLVVNNHPRGLEECMANSTINVTSGLYTSITSDKSESM